MPSFLEKLKKQIKSIELDTGKTIDEYKSAFREEIAAVIQVYLDTMSDRLYDINSEIIRSLKERKNESVAAQDVFSKSTERRILAIIVTWLKQDEGLRERFKDIKDAYSRKLKSVDMEQEMAAVLKEFDSDFVAHVAKANNYAAEWKKLTASVPFTFVNPIVTNTMKWFSELTAAELHRDFLRDFNK